MFDPLPSVNKAYSMVRCVEKQRQIQNAYPSDVSAMVAHSNNIENLSHSKQCTGVTNRYAGFKPKLSKEKKTLLKRSFAKALVMSTMNVSSCMGFQIGTNDWKKVDSKYQLIWVDTPYTSILSIPNTNVSGSNIGSMIQTEIAKYFSKQNKGCNVAYPIKFSCFAGEFCF